MGAALDARRQSPAIRWRAARGVDAQVATSRSIAAADKRCGVLGAMTRSPRPASTAPRRCGRSARPYRARCLHRGARAIAACPAEIADEEDTRFVGCPQTRRRRLRPAADRRDAIRHDSSHPDLFVVRACRLARRGSVGVSRGEHDACQAEIGRPPAARCHLQPRGRTAADAAVEIPAVNLRLMTWSMGLPARAPRTSPSMVPP